MRRFIAVLSLFAMALIFQAAAPASAAHMTKAGDNAAVLTADSLLIQTQGYGGGGGGYNNDDDDNDDDSDSYRHRRRHSEYGYRRHNGYGYDYCRSCAYRCADGAWCPPRCWGWWRNCRWNRREY